jgi:hypothetical protein
MIKGKPVDVAPKTRPADSTERLLTTKLIELRTEGQQAAGGKRVPRLLSTEQFIQLQKDRKAVDTCNKLREALVQATKSTADNEIYKLKVDLAVAKNDVVAANAKIAKLEEEIADLRRKLKFSCKSKRKLRRNLKKRSSVDAREEKQGIEVVRADLELSDSDSA